MTALELLESMVNGRDSGQLTKKQSNYLSIVAVKEKIWITEEEILIGGYYVRYMGRKFSRNGNGSVIWFQSALWRKNYEEKQNRDKEIADKQYMDAINAIK